MTATATESDQQYRREVGAEAKRQIGLSGLMTLGAKIRGYRSNGAAGLVLTARILPFNANGERAARPRRMEVDIRLNGSDYWDVTVSYLKGRREVTHWEGEDLGPEDLARLGLALDWDGPEPMNPRYWN
jgi:hypothetical protein